MKRTKAYSTKPLEETPEQRKSRENVEQIARNLSELARSVSLLLNGQLKRKALLVLLANSSGLSQSQVDRVLAALETLDKDWLK